ncbi:dde superfamily endonuclease [Holotrichia oblita]|uniref:Dde superfamily endonuclease n=1 Tax=Holotrichia oblita TaxID=644536 RepID=A0ACB9STM9_HOLOL|nr:dde superfamily endonuclease [Holotrichia oblita]
MFTFSAAGLTTPPIPGKRLRSDIQASVPVILFIDGHSTHLTYQLSELCRELQIITICLYPNSTRILQPADVAAFKPIKTGWRKGVLEWRRSNPSDVLTKEKLCPILDKVIKKYSKEGNIRSGFRACGLYPFDENAIDYSKCLGHNKSDSVKEIDKNNFQLRTLTFEKFRYIVGKDHITKFKEMSAVPLNTEEGTDKNFNILYRLWRELDTNVKATEISDRDGSTNTVDANNNQDTKQYFPKETANEECVELGLMILWQEMKSKTLHQLKLTHITLRSIQEKTLSLCYQMWRKI